MRAEEIRELANDEIQARIAELQEEQFRLRFRSATEALEDPLRFRLIRKDIARLMTVLRERELTGETGPPAEAPAKKTPARAKKKTTRSRAAR